MLFSAVPPGRVDWMHAYLLIMRSMGTWAFT